MAAELLDFPKRVETTENPERVLENAVVRLLKRKPFYGHLLLGLSLGLTSLFGIVGLAGIIVNGSLVLVDFTNEERRRGKAPQEAIITAAKGRFRPILLTAITTFLGIFPLIIERSIQAQFLIPLAVSIGVGVLLGTALLMLLTPALTMAVEDIAARWKARTASAPPAP